jgi:hypothetical protein
MLNTITVKLASFADHIAAAMMYRRLSCLCCRLRGCPPSSRCAQSKDSYTALPFATEL